MDCIVPCESWVVDGFRRGTVLYLVKFGEVEGFRHGVTTGGSASEKMQK